MKRALLIAVALALTACTSSRGGLPATLELDGAGLVAAGYDGRTLAIAYDGSGRAAVVESETGLPLTPAVTWDGAGLYVRVRGDGEQRFPAEPGEGVRVRVPVELAELLGVLPAVAWLVLEPVQEEPAP